MKVYVMFNEKNKSYFYGFTRNKEIAEKIILNLKDKGLNYSLKEYDMPNFSGSKLYFAESFKYSTNKKSISDVFCAKNLAMYTDEWMDAMEKSIEFKYFYDKSDKDLIVPFIDTLEEARFITDLNTTKEQFEKYYKGRLYARIGIIKFLGV